MKIICTNGKGREKNPFDPYSPKHHPDTDYSEFDWFGKTHPSLLTFTPDGKPFMENGEFNGEFVWQYYDVVRDCWDYHKNAKDFKDCDTRQVYIIQPEADHIPQAEKMVFKATPGTWFYQENSKHIVRPTLQPVAEADARLISAAPELLEALQILLAAYQSDGTDDFYNLDVEQIAEQAIHKALGGKG